MIATNSLAPIVPSPESETQLQIRQLVEFPDHPDEVDDPPWDKPTLLCVSAAGVTERQMSFLWAGRIPDGMVTILAGPPQGKTSIALDLAARVSRGLPMPLSPPSEANEPADVLILNNKDDRSRILKPRLRVAGADLNRVHFITDVLKDGRSRSVLLPLDAEQIAARVKKRGVRLVIIDRLDCYLDDASYSHRHRLMEDVLLEINGHAAATLAITADKGTCSAALYRACQSSLMVRSHPESDGVHVLIQGKSIQVPCPSLAYTFHKPTGEQVSRVCWTEELDETIEDFQLPAARKRKAAQKVASQIEEALGSGPLPSQDLDRLLREQGHGQHAIKEGRRLAGVQAYRLGYGRQGKWMAHLGQTSSG